MKTTHQERNTTPRPTTSLDTHPNKTRQSHQAHAEKDLPASVKLINTIRYTQAADASATNNNPQQENPDSITVGNDVAAPGMSGEPVGSASSFTGGRCSTHHECTRHVDVPPVHDLSCQGSLTVGVGSGGAGAPALTLVPSTPVATTSAFLV